MDRELENSGYKYRGPQFRVNTNINNGCQFFLLYPVTILFQAGSLSLLTLWFRIFIIARLLIIF